MRKLVAFNFITLDGYFEGPEKGDISWHKHGKEENEFSAKMLTLESTLLFGRVTYDLMAGYWPTTYAIKNDPIVAEGMNKADKIVFSRTLRKAEWNNTMVVKGNIGEEIEKLKQMSGKDMTLLGSGSIINQFTELGMIDEYQIMIDPVVIGRGTPIFRNIRNQMDLKLIETNIFKSGVVLLIYRPTSPDK
jgi:dihydrofolate reductase